MTSTLQQGDDLAAHDADAPRVSLIDMERRIAQEHFFTAGEALLALGEMEGDPSLDILTIAVLVLDNGWMLVGTSAPAAKANYDEAKGRTFARDDALRKLWPLEGYLLRNKLSAQEKRYGQRQDP